MSNFDLAAVLLNPDFRWMLATGLALTLAIAAASWCLGMALATLLLVVRLTPSRAARGAVAAYVSYHRNVPTLVQLMVWYFGIASLLPDAAQGWFADHDGEAVFAVIALGLCQAAYFSEDMRSGLRSIPPGQMEAARALGHGYFGALRSVVLPQALRNAVPALVNHTVSLFKNSSLAMAIGVSELTHAVREIDSQSFRTFESYLVATVLYLAVSLLIMGAGAWLAQRTRIAAAR